MDFSGVFLIFRILFITHYILFLFIVFVLITGNGYTKQGASSPAIDCKTTVAKSSFSGTNHFFGARGDYLKKYGCNNETLSRLRSKLSISHVPTEYENFHLVVSLCFSCLYYPIIKAICILKHQLLSLLYAWFSIYIYIRKWFMHRGFLEKPIVKRSC